MKLRLRLSQAASIALGVEFEVIDDGETTISCAERAEESRPGCIGWNVARHHQESGGRLGCGMRHLLTLTSRIIIAQPFFTCKPTYTYNRQTDSRASESRTDVTKKETNEKRGGYEDKAEIPKA